MNKLLNISIATLSLAIGLPLMAQKSKSGEEKTQKTHISITTEKNGKKQVVDTVLLGADQTAINAYIKTQGIATIDPPTPPSPPDPLSPPVPPSPPMNRINSDEKIIVLRNSDDSDFELDREASEMALMNAKIAMEKALSKTNLSKKEIKSATEDMEKEFRDLNNSDKKVVKKIIIKKS